MTDMAEILTGLREAKQKLSEEYAETFIFLIEQIETALIEMGNTVKEKKQASKELIDVRFFTEMVNLITAQRAYELCSKAITTSDTMMEQANNLKR